MCRRHGFSEVSYYLWCSKFGGMKVSGAKRFKELESEKGGSRLKKSLSWLTPVAYAKTLILKLLI